MLQVFDQSLLPPQMQHSVIISNKHGIAHDLSNDYGLEMLKS